MENWCASTKAYAVKISKTYNSGHLYNPDTLRSSDRSFHCQTTRRPPLYPDDSHQEQLFPTNLIQLGSKIDPTQLAKKSFQRMDSKSWPKPTQKFWNRSTSTKNQMGLGCMWVFGASCRTWCTITYCQSFQRSKSKLCVGKVVFVSFLSAKFELLNFSIIFNLDTSKSGLGPAECPEIEILL